MRRQPSHRVIDAPSHDDEQSGAFTVDDVLDSCGVRGMHHWLLLVYAGMSWGSFALQSLIVSFLGAAAQCHWNGVTDTQSAVLTAMTFVGECECDKLALQVHTRAAIAMLTTICPNQCLYRDGSWCDKLGCCW